MTVNASDDLFYKNYPFKKLVDEYLGICECDLKHLQDQCLIDKAFSAMHSAKVVACEREEAVKKGDREKVREIDTEIRPLLIERLVKSKYADYQHKEHVKGGCETVH